MTASERSKSRYWTFEQALAWVLYRREDIVSYVGPRSGGSLSWVGMYLTSFKPIANKIGNGEELLATLRNGDLVASGYHETNNGTRQNIPPEDWLKLRINGVAV